MSEPTNDKLRIEYEKSRLFRVVHADGAFGGTTPRLGLFISFYSERFPIPRVLTYEVTSSGAPGAELSAERESKQGIFREVEVGVTLDFSAAKSLASWLNEKVAELEKARDKILAAPKPEEEVNR
jgi:hypothetical protein